MTPYTRKRVRQVERWLEDVFPLAYRHKVVFRDFGDPYDEDSPAKIGDSDKVRGPRFEIRLNKQANLGDLIDALQHEWAHCRTTRPPKLERLRILAEEEHDDEFWLERGRIYRRYHDQGGDLKSQEYE